MKTKELLEHIGEDMLDDRANLLEGAGDELFSDTKIVRYLNEAERELCKDALVLEDFTTEDVCEIDLTENEMNYALDASIIQVKAVRLSDSDVDLTRVGYEDNSLAGPWVYDPGYWDVNATLVETPGRPSRYSTDMGTRIIRVRQKPDADAAALTLKLTVIRYPLVAMSVQDLEKEPEVPAEHHLKLCLFAAGSCLTKTADVDAESRRLGREWLAEWEAYKKGAKKDKARLQQAMPQFRFGGWANDGHCR